MASVGLQRPRAKLAPKPPAASRPTRSKLFLERKSQTDQFGASLAVEFGELGAGPWAEFGAEFGSRIWRAWRRVMRGVWCGVWRKVLAQSLAQNLASFERSSAQNLAQSPAWRPPEFPRMPWRSLQGRLRAFVSWVPREQAIARMTRRPHSAMLTARIV